MSVAVAKHSLALAIVTIVVAAVLAKFWFWNGRATSR
jgi:hypothetical protein